MRYYSILALILFVPLFPVVVAVPSNAAPTVQLSDYEAVTVRLARTRRPATEGVPVTWEWAGSGAITELGIVTAWHCISSSHDVAAQTRGGDWIRADTWYKLGDIDVGLIVPRTLPPGTIKAPVIQSDLTSSATAVCVGHWGRTFTTGRPVRSIGEIFPHQPDNIFQQYTCTNVVEHGMSGGPVFVNGVVVAVVNAKWADSPMAGEGVNYLGPISHARVAALRR